MNLCNAIECPYNDARIGCMRYGHAGRCHLAWLEPGIQHPSIIQVHANQYWLFVEDDASLAEFKAQNDVFLDQAKEHYRLELMSKYSRE